MAEKEGKVSKGEEAQVVWNESVYLARHLMQWLGGNENRVAHAITILGYASEMVLMHGDGDFDKISADYRYDTQVQMVFPNLKSISILRDALNGLEDMFKSGEIKEQYEKSEE